MAYTISTTGMEELEAKLRLAGEAAQGVAAASLYEGAGIVADAVSQAVHGIATSPFKYARNGEKRKPSPEEKAILEGAAKGIAKFSIKLTKKGKFNAKIKFAGDATYKTSTKSIQITIK